jgi:hypothetical protein
VYTHHPRTIDELEAAITEETNATPRNMTHRVLENFRQFMENGGDHLEDSIFKPLFNVLSNNKIYLPASFFTSIPCIFKIRKAYMPQLVSAFFGAQEHHTEELHNL